MDGFESLITAWNIWSEGKEVDKELIIWGKSLRWWNRAGQLAQIWGAFVLVVEIIGRERFLRLESWSMEVLAPWNSPWLLSG
ncbi:MAG TPA: hypothetical protein VFG47_07815, partial [Geminicoccaceae bacterium]|nr:hypothetical protein [Geminicoccaceae bacterium]